MSQSSDEQHPISLYLKIWCLLFVLSTLSYLVDYFQVQGIVRWTLILVFMFLKAGLIIGIFMHVSWEKYSVKLLLFVPPIAILVFIILMAIEADYTYLNRLTFWQ
ncbi:cytochrome C oxidase subunit IV family protein [Thalassotalea psychrophila]|uniref:Cytochrome C oxidase subunit IV family protein n=1 Tax=Thalassotalea psychrophila TaxID=3065647 RepID=A0ABY9TP27_9GAMM|nr:cytochrome C oxidase subunit IV family protein [Colwelliaceae bacterium SQ149]